MRIKVLDAPLGHEFDQTATYLVYGIKDGKFVFDEEGEACFLRDMDWEEVTSES